MAICLPKEVKEIVRHHAYLFTERSQEIGWHHGYLFTERSQEIVCHQETICLTK
ncbi:hypothetical protein P5F75_09445 [Caldifermentibacillus hisashii]|uniref:hypothetical protein n=1 Tax=Caldifermentibacillus hisashii TaxID=996558 RepID=UPI002E1BD17F|nr:hypothetical protein [Caldifermentibacillus hisashii]